MGHSAYAEFITGESFLCLMGVGGGNPKRNQLKLNAQLSLATCSTLLKMLQTCSLLLKKLPNVLSVVGKLFDNLPVMSAVWLHFGSYVA